MSEDRETGARVPQLAANRRGGSSRRWRKRLLGAMSQLLIIFAGVTAAFMADEYREEQAQQEQLRQARQGLIVELGRYEVRGREHADSITQRLERWRGADRSNERAVPAHYRIPGATHPPTAAWDAAVSSGAAGLFEPEMRLQLAYFYKEFSGIHDNYARHLGFVEREFLPRAEAGADAFYDVSGRLEAEFRVQMALLEEFGRDLRRLSAQAGQLKRRLAEEELKPAS